MSPFPPPSSSSRDTSPDPIVQPSSPLGPHPHSHRSARKSGATSASTWTLSRSRSRNLRATTRDSPSRSVILDTPTGAGGESPWRIRVTVEAEPRDGIDGRNGIIQSTGKMKTVPLKAETEETLSPAKGGGDGNGHGGGGGNRGNTRKRKGTPIRRGRSTRHQPPPPTGVDDDDDDIMTTNTTMNDNMNMNVAHPAAAHRRTSGRIGRLHSQSAPTLRSQRLSLAREELDIALQEAVGYGDEHTTRLLGDVDFSRSTRMPGDATLSRNEDFSMISVETLQTAKDSSMVSSGWGLADSQGSAGAGYTASSPPKRETWRRSVLARPVEFGTRSGSARRFTSGSATRSRRNGADVMSWKPTGPTAGIRDVTPSSQLRPDSHLPSTASHPNDVSGSYGMDGAKDQDISQGLDADIWQDEASRSVREQPEEENAEKENVEDAAEDEFDAEYQLQSDAAAQTASHSPGMEDLFAGEPLKPARGKIPKTWRRSSGMDFSYVDSPAHGMVDEEKRHSTDGSGVLTPPSTSEEEDDRDELNPDGSDDDAEQGEEGHDGQEEAQSEWNQPDAEATRYEGQNHLEQDATVARTDSASPPSPGSNDDDDTGDFFQHNMPQVYARQNRPRRPPPRPRPTRDEGTVDLTDLLGLKSSPVKPAASKQTPAATQPPRITSSSSGSRPRMHGHPFDGKMKFNPPIQLGSGGKAKVIESPLRRSLLKSSKLHGGSPDQKRQQLHHHHHKAPPPSWKDFIVPDPAQRQQDAPSDVMSASSVPALGPAVLDRSQTRFPNSQSRVEVELDSFASKASDQRQLLMEMTPRVGTGVQQSYVEETSEDVLASSSPAPVVRSYEEHLNVESPQKVPVHFGDSSSVLPPTKLFLSRAGRQSVDANHFGPVDQPVQQQQSQRMAPKPVPFVDRRVPATKDAVGKVGGFLGRLSETFWSTVVRPTGPTAIWPETQEEKHRGQPQEGEFQQSVSASWDDEDSSEEMGMFNTTLRTAIRNRYGVLPSSFPWTMAHMRTLHRMLNSLVSERPDSLIPNAGPLPEFLVAIVDTPQDSVVGREFLFTREHAYVVFSFLQILVDKEVVEAMERGEVQPLGDDLSRRLRGVVEGDPSGRKGWEGVFLAREDERWREVGEIGSGFVVGALGCAVRSNEMSEERGRGVHVLG